MTMISDVDARATLPARPRAAHVSGTPPATLAPAAVAVDLGSAYTRIWAAERPMLHAPTISDTMANPAALVQRGRIIDPAGSEAMLTRLLRYAQPLPKGPLVVACRPVLTAADDQRTLWQTLTNVFNPSRVLFIDSVRAAAIGAGASSGPLIVADVGAQLTEVAVLADGAVASAHRAEFGMDDAKRPAAPEAIADIIVGLVADLHCHPGSKDLVTTALLRGLLLVGGGAHPQLADHTARLLGASVVPAAHPRITAVQGAALAALSALRRATATPTG